MASESMTTIRPIQSSDLERVLIWRNHPDVRNFMVMQHEISKQEHAQWFTNLENNLTLKVLIVENRHVPIGLAQFKNISMNSNSDWGFYLAPEAPKGSGKMLANAALDFAFNQLHLHKVSAQVIASNAVSIRFHEKFGFKHEGTLRAQILIKDIHHDLLCYGLLADEWAANITLQP